MIAMSRSYTSNDSSNTSTDQGTAASYANNTRTQTFSELAIPNNKPQRDKKYWKPKVERSFTKYK